MNEQLLTCPRCDRYGFQPAGLRKHVCRGAIPGLIRRRLRIDELRRALAPESTATGERCPKCRVLITADNAFGWRTYCRKCGPSAERKARPTKGRS